MNASVRKVNAAIVKIGVEKFEEATNPSNLPGFYCAETWKEALDAFKNDVGEEHYKSICENPCIVELITHWESDKLTLNKKLITNKIMEMFLKESVKDICKEDVEEYLYHTSNQEEMLERSDSDEEEDE